MNDFFQGMLAVGQEGATGAGCQQFAMFLLLIFAVFYFIVIRPQRKEQDRQKQFLDRLKEGDRVIMASGILGRIVALETEIVTVDVGDRTRIRFLRSQVARYQADAAEEPKSNKSDDQDQDESKSRAKKKRR